MKFYVITDSLGETRGCETTLKAARAEADQWLGEEGYAIDAVEVDVSADSIRRLLGTLGGYARSQRRVETMVGDA